MANAPSQPIINSIARPDIGNAQPLLSGRKGLAIAEFGQIIKTVVLQEQPRQSIGAVGIGDLGTVDVTQACRL